MDVDVGGLEGKKKNEEWRSGTRLFAKTFENIKNRINSKSETELQKRNTNWRNREEKFEMSYKITIRDGQSKCLFGNHQEKQMRPLPKVMVWRN